jgi:hypothetical protein
VEEAQKNGETIQFDLVDKDDPCLREMINQFFYFCIGMSRTLIAEWSLFSVPVFTFMLITDLISFRRIWGRLGRFWRQPQAGTIWKSACPYPERGNGGMAHFRASEKNNYTRLRRILVRPFL